MWYFLLKSETLWKKENSRFLSKIPHNLWGIFLYLIFLYFLWKIISPVSSIYSSQLTLFSFGKTLFLIIFIIVIFTVSTRTIYEFLKVPEIYIISPLIFSLFLFHSQSSFFMIFFLRSRSWIRNILQSRFYHCRGGQV